MGIDASLMVKSKCKYSAEELNELNYRFMEASCYGDTPKAICEAEQQKNDPHFYYKIGSSSRYYGRGYERGDWPTISYAITWLRFNFPDSEILYGGDCYDIEEYPVFTLKDQQEMDIHWCKNEHLPYRDRGNDHNRVCPNCNKICTQYMWGSQKAGVNCLGCEFTEETTDDGITWSTTKSGR